MFPLLLLLLVLVMGLSAADVDANTKQCYNLTIPVQVTSANLIWGRPKFITDVDVTNVLIDFNRRDFATTFTPFNGIQNNTAFYNIAGTYCQSKHHRPKTTIIATHGATLDR